ncbi:unnamed protein product [marine sediment metagenome]|uniref:Uncharacterized protein n=1 Tax=marine sediment metagenome TaxID=412755 RepID=X1Q635_9ZZZZ
MKRKYRLTIEIIGFLIILLLGISIIQDIILLIFKEVNIILLFIIRLVSALVLIYIMVKFTNFGRDINNFLKESSVKAENKIKKRKKK